MYLLEPPRWGNSNENTQYTFILKKVEKISLLCLLTWRYDLHSLARNTPVSNMIFIVPKVLEPVKFDYILPKFYYGAKGKEPEKIKPSLSNLSIYLYRQNYHILVNPLVSMQGCPI